MKRLILGVLLAGVMWWGACAVPAWVNTAEQDAEVAAPIAASLVEVIDPALAPVVTLVENGFNALIKTLDTYKAMPTATNLQAVQAAFAAVNANVQQLTSAAQIKNTASQTTVASVVQLLSQAVAEIAALVPQGAAAANSEFRIPDSEGNSVDSGGESANSGGQSVNSALPMAKGWKAKDFKKAFNEIAQRDVRLKKLR
jgi:soluble cytochrome b562